MTFARFRRGFSLVEVTLALGVAAFCLLALFGLLPIGVNSNQTTIEQTAAASMAASVFADLRAAPLATPVSPQFAIPIPPTSNPPMYTLYLREDGTMAQKTTNSPPGNYGWDIDLTQNARYRVTLIFNPPAANQLNVTPVRVIVTWPAIADPRGSVLPSNFSGSFETLTGLDRN